MAEHEKVFVVCDNMCLEEGMTADQINAALGGYVQVSQLSSYAKSSVLSNYALKTDVPTITSGTAAPSGGKNGDIYIQY